MVKKYNCFISAVDDKFFFFNPHSLATAIFSNPEGYSEDDALLALTEAQKSALFDGNVFIAEDSQAHSLSKYYSDKVKYGRTLTISDATTFACNMNCVYCFENQTKNQKAHLSFSDRISMMAQLIDLFAPDIDCLDYVFFGGEPLLNLDYVEEMSEFIVKHYPALTINFSFTSNGTLINERFIALCKKFDFKEIRVTIDGTSNIHNARRVMKNGGNSYDLIIENIKNLCQKTDIRVMINTVIDADNADCYMDMVADLVHHLGEYIIGDNPKVVFNVGTLCHPLFDTSHTKDKGTTDYSESSLYYTLSEKLIKIGATITSPLYSAHCMNSAEKTFTVAPTGDIYKCVTGIGSKRFLLASYDAFICNPVSLLKENVCQIEQSHRPQCLECDYLTMCNGGCKCQHYEKGAVLCRKKLLETEMVSLMHLLAAGAFTESSFFRERPGDPI